ncbi:hypothetical protein GGS21DRAFT_461870 [Xylaria nigripes]|nr:hypothetical protein GGS21DRAFT_461870 [Xylaria nigripes]
MLQHSVHEYAISIHATATTVSVSILLSSLLILAVFNLLLSSLANATAYTNFHLLLPALGLGTNDSTPILRIHHRHSFVTFAFVLYCCCSISKSQRIFIGVIPTTGLVSLCCRPCSHLKDSSNPKPLHNLCRHLKQGTYHTHFLQLSESSRPPRISCNQSCKFQLF